MHTLPFSQYPFRKGLQSFYTCTFLDMHTPSIGPYPSREGHQSYYPWTPAHSQTWKLCPLAHIPPGRAPEFLSTDPCTFPDMETPSVGPYPSREGHGSFYPQIPAHSQTWKLCPLAHIPPGRGTRVFIHRPLHIPRHGNSVR